MESLKEKLTEEEISIVQVYLCLTTHYKDGEPEKVTINNHGHNICNACKIKFVEKAIKDTELSKYDTIKLLDAFTSHINSPHHLINNFTFILDKSNKVAVNS